MKSWYATSELCSGGGGGGGCGGRPEETAINGCEIQGLSLDADCDYQGPEAKRPK